ncbi:group II intron reverse transcriptase/maturase [Mastigocoleus sp. MO_188.B34]|uniref:group II intron reverse transcriptase/maturase n=1 Tax=Mastigocoleus sp. MO_188.B34 TaxID=3036635 RepID=UPI002627C0E7|nr:group II intron reverse transcriptase/maturase [Mastigocoleus sp. MO_188.B34]MDJ0693775.1 group II intron reverse transcriptase/maturase [Mastigocoleus sp. MO_188.B34]
MSQSLTIRYEWKNLPWKKIQVKVFKLQKRIYQASLSGNIKKVHRLQRLLAKSWYARCLAVRRVTQENQGKKTAGVDGVKSLTAKKRLKMVKELEIKSSGLPTRRVWIPKPGKEEKRPLGIPVMKDRATQTLLKLALEPEWEAKFEPRSFGFRPGRSCQDAIEAIFTAVCQKAKYVLDADIAKCFDKINHQKLLEKLNTFPTFERVIRNWLKSGVIDQGNLFPTEEGTPQGGCISPLLANIALHGLETTISNAFPAKMKIDGKWHLWKPQFIRYADDFVILHPNKQALERCKEIASQWLAQLDLELKPSKTRITHTLNKIESNCEPGFDFLGFNIRSYPVGKNNCGRNNGVKTGFKTIVRPSKDKVKIHYRNLAKKITQCRSATQDELISQLIPIITGWCNYYSRVCSKEIFSQLDHKLFWKLFRGWAKFRHPKKSGKWIARKYWHIQKHNNWTFGNELILPKHSNTKITRHIKVKGEASPFDGNWTYWSKRKGEYPGISKKVTITIKKQKGKCAECGLNFHPEDLIEIHHKNGNHRDNRFENLVAVHLHCHDQIHGEIGKLSTQLSTHDKGQLGEEPDEGQTFMSGSEAESEG